MRQQSILESLERTKLYTYFVYVVCTQKNNLEKTKQTNKQRTNSSYSAINEFSIKAVVSDRSF